MIFIQYKVRMVGASNPFQFHYCVNKYWHDLDFERFKEYILKEERYIRCIANNKFGFNGYDNDSSPLVEFTGRARKPKGFRPWVRAN